MLLKINHPFFTYEHLLDSPENLTEIKNFLVTEENGLGLEYYLKETADDEEQAQMNKTYLVKDKVTKEIVGYFSLRTGLFTLTTEEDDSFDSIPAIELSNFAINGLYRRNHPETIYLGRTLFSQFIVPIIMHIKSFVAVRALYIYALPEDKLIQHYSSMGFHRLSPEEEAFVHNHVKPRYDKGCIFMYQII